MSDKDALCELLETFPGERVREVLDFARFLSIEDDREERQRLGREQFAQAYGPDEPEYTEADIRKDGGQ